MLHILSSVKESLKSVFPIALIVLVLSVTFVTLETGVLVLFLFGTILLILGMSFFTLGSGISMEPLGDGIGKSLNKKSFIILPLIICFVLGFIITVSFIMALGTGLAATKKGKHTGGTVIKGRLADFEAFSEFVDTEVDEERELLLILAPSKISPQIMEDVNRHFGISSEANGIIFSLPTEKAFKI